MKAFLTALLLIAAVEPAPAGLLDALLPGTNSWTQPRPAMSPSLNALSEDQVVQGLKEALGHGVQQAVAQLGHDGGFLTNLQVRIPMPQKLQSAEKTLRALGQDKMADEFVATMNRAAEQAVPQAVGVFVDAIQRMTIQDAKNILTGPNDAATQYFRRITQTNLYDRFLPIVKGATEKTGVTSTYKQLMAALSQNSHFGQFGSALLKNETVDLDGYVTDRALDGLFKMVAQEEARIRKDPVARTSELLQKVFGAISRPRP